MKDISEYTNELYKRIDEKNEALGKRLSFKPWMKYAAVAAAFIVVVAAALVAINVSGAWRNDNLVHPNSGTETPGVIASTGSDGGEPDGSSAPDSENPGSVPGGEGTPVINGDSSQNGGNSGSENHGGQGSETPDKPDGTQTLPSEEPEVVIEGDFMKDNMPAVTYRIAGESRTFVYQKSSVIKTSESGDGKPTYSVVDRYADPDGATISVNADTGDLMRYDSNCVLTDYYEYLLPKWKASEIVKRIVSMTDVDSIGFDSAGVSVLFSEDRYCVTLTVAKGSIEVCVDMAGELIYFYVKSNA